MSAEDASGWLRDHSSRIIAFGVLLAILHLGRSVLIPVTLALMLSFVMAPFIRAMRRLRIGRVLAVFIALSAMALSCAGVAAVLGAQVLHMVERLPQYESNVQLKLKALEDITASPIRRPTDQTVRPAGTRSSDEALPAPPSGSDLLTLAMPAEARPPSQEPESRPLPYLWNILTTVWPHMQFAGIVLLVLFFVLLEHDSLRERFILIAGAKDIRAAAVALDEAGDRLSRYFVSQAVVNIAFGLAIWMSLSLLQVPQASLCAVVAGVLRFIPYFGVAVAAFLAAALALAVDPGWSLAPCALGAFFLLDLVVGQLLEPHIFGHVTGLSPLSLVVGAIIWSGLWGAAGLLLSTPLTVCLLVVGRHMKGLSVLELVLGKETSPTFPQNLRPHALRRGSGAHRRC